MKRQFSACQTPRSIYPSILNSFPVIRTTSAKDRRFHVPQPTFLFLLETPLRLSRNMLHGWKDNSMLVTTIVPIYLQQFPSYSSRKCKKSQFSRTAAHIFVSPGDATAIITQCVSNTHKFDRRLTHFRRSQLHWLHVVDRVRLRVCVQVFRDLHKMAPDIMSTYCQPVSGISGRCHLRSADRGHLDFPRMKLASYGGRSFAYAGPSNWNSLPAYIRDSSLSLSSFKHHLKTFLFSFY